MLRILKDGKAISLKEQEKIVGAKGSEENVGRNLSAANLTKRRYRNTAPDFVVNKGLRPAGGNKSAKTSRTTSKK